MIKSPYRRGADDGFYFGLYLVAMFFASVFAQTVPMLSFVSLVLMFSAPAVIYRFLRSYDRELGPAASFPMLWMQGVVIFFCGILIAGAALVVYMKWIEPDFVLSQIKGVAALAGTAPGTFVDAAAGLAAEMIEANFIPTPTAIVAELVMLAIVSGSVLSIILSAFLALRRNRLQKA